MAELADAHGSGPCESNFMEVQVLLAAPKFENPNIIPIGNKFGFLLYKFKFYYITYGQFVTAFVKRSLTLFVFI